MIIKLLNLGKSNVQDYKSLTSMKTELINLNLLMDIQLLKFSNLEKIK